MNKIKNINYFKIGDIILGSQKMIKIKENERASFSDDKKMEITKTYIIKLYMKDKIINNDEFFLLSNLVAEHFKVNNKMQILDTTREIAKSFEKK